MEARRAEETEGLLENGQCVPASEDFFLAIVRTGFVQVFMLRGRVSYKALFIYTKQPAS